MSEPAEEKRPPRWRSWLPWLAVGGGALLLWECVKDDPSLVRGLLALLAGWLDQVWPQTFGPESEWGVLVPGLWLLTAWFLILSLLPKMARAVGTWLGANALGLLVAGMALHWVAKGSPRAAVLCLLVLAPVFGYWLRLPFRPEVKRRRSVGDWFSSLRPVIGRELLSQSRQRSTYWGRVVAVAGLLVVCMVYLSEHDVLSGQGWEMFRGLHIFVLVSAGLLVPFVTADCVSRERREGTLNLLFLTPLRPGQIALAKWLAHAVKAAGFYLALAPVMAIPILAGGVAWQDVVNSLTVSLVVIGWALAAGIATSSLGRSPTESLLAALFGGTLSVPIGVALGSLGAVLFDIAVENMAESGFAGLYFERVGESAVNLAFPNPWGWQFGTNPAALFLGLMASFVVLPLAGTVFLLWLAGVSMSQSLRIALPGTRRPFRLTWGEKKSAPQDTVWKRDFHVPPVGLALGRRWLRRILERDPIGWLGRRDSAACSVSWLTLASVVLFGGVTLAVDRTLNVPFSVMAWCLVGAMTLIAASAFRRERQTGLMELLLVTPVRERQILHGFVRGLWAQGRPAAVVLWGLWCWRMATRGIEEEDSSSVFLLASLLTMPVIGLYHSLRLRHSVLALGMTLLAGIVVPVMTGILVRAAEVLVRPYSQAAALLWAEGARLFMLLLTAFLCYRSLHRMLVERRFASAES